MQYWPVKEYYTTQDLCKVLNIKPNIDDMQNGTDRYLGRVN